MHQIQMLVWIKSLFSIKLEKKTCTVAVKPSVEVSITHGFLKEVEEVAFTKL